MKKTLLLLVLLALIAPACSPFVVPVGEKFTIESCVEGRDVLLERDGFICDCVGPDGRVFRMFSDSIPDAVVLVGVNDN